MSAVAYRLSRVCKQRTRGGVTFTLQVPELTIGCGTFAAVVGPSGCGKSTLLDLLALVLEASEAEEFAIGLRDGERHRLHPIVQLSEAGAARIRRRHIGYVLQSGGLLPYLTVRENILLTAQLSGVPVSDQDLRRLIEVLDLGDQLAKKPQYLSGGQRQRVAVARALVHRPCIVLADEPTAAVDYPTALDIRDELKDLAREVGATVIMVTHDRSLVDGVADLHIELDLVRRSRSQISAIAVVRDCNHAGVQSSRAHVE